MTKMESMCDCIRGEAIFGYMKGAMKEYCTKLLFIYERYT